MTVDRRIRVDGEFVSIEPAQFLEVTLPEMFDADRLRPVLQELQAGHSPSPSTAAPGR